MQRSIFRISKFKDQAETLYYLIIFFPPTRQPKILKPYAQISHRFNQIGLQKNIRFVMQAL